MQSPYRLAFGVLFLCTAAFIVYHGHATTTKYFLEADLAESRDQVAESCIRRLSADDRLNAATRALRAANAREARLKSDLAILTDPEPAYYADDSTADVRFAHWTPLNARFVRGVPIIWASVGDSAGWFMLDTGCGETVIDEAWALQIGMDVVPAEWMPISHAPKSYVRGAVVRVGGAAVPSKRLWCYDFRPIAKAMGMTDLCGAVGGDFLAKHPVRLRYAEGGIDVGAPPRPMISPENVTIPFFTLFSKPYTTVVFGQGAREPIQVPTLIDTGFAGSISCPAKYASRLSLEADAHESLKTVMLDGEKSVRIAHEVWLDIGTYRIGPKDAYVVECNGVDAFVIGTAVLSQFTVTIDYPRSLIVLAPAGIGTAASSAPPRHSSGALQR